MADPARRGSVFWIVSCTLLLTEIVVGETIKVALDDEPAAA